MYILKAEWVILFCIMYAILQFASFYLVSYYIFMIFFNNYITCVFVLFHAWIFIVNFSGIVYACLKGRQHRRRIQVFLWVNWIKKKLHPHLPAPDFQAKVFFLKSFFIHTNSESLI